MTLSPDLVAHLQAAGQRGSGYLIAPRRVLTALHVLLPEKAPDRVPAGVTARVQLAGDVAAVADRAATDWRRGAARAAFRAAAGEGGLWLDAALLWPPPGAAVGDADIAVLEIIDPATSATANQTAAPWACGICLRNGELFDAIGFPEFAKDPEPDSTLVRAEQVFAVSEGLDATGAPVDRREGPIRRLRVTSPTPDQANGWRGLSGATLVCGERLMGVAHDRAGGLHGNARIGYYPIAALAADSGFWAAAGIDPPDAGRMARATQFDLARHLPRLDRAPETTGFAALIDRDLPAPGRDRAAPARLVLLPGHAWDDLPQLAERLKGVLADRFPGAGNAYATLPQLDLRQATTATEVRLTLLLREWAVALGSPRGALEGVTPGALERTVADWLTAADKPRVVLMQHNDRRFGKGCCELITSLRDLVARLPETRPPCLVFLSILGGQACEFADGMFTKAVWPDKLDALDRLVAEDLRPLDQAARLWRMDPPSDVSHGDLADWFAALAAEQWRPTAPSRRDIDRALPDYQYTPMRRVKETLDAALQMEPIR